MRKTIIEKVLRELVYDTRTYRYKLVDNKILRIPLECLGRTTVLSDWKVVHVFNR